MSAKVSIVSLGCSKNLVDSERMLYKCRSHGYELVTDPAQSDAVIVNTCGFIQSAKEEAIDTILELCQLKKEGTIKKIILTGCLTERYREEVADEFQEVDAIVGFSDEKDIVDILDSVMGNERVVSFAPKNEAELDGKRILTTLPFFAYVKISEGCSNNCSYCAIPQIRGKYRDVPFEKIIEEAKFWAENGVTEITLIAQDTTRYGEQLYKKNRLPELLKELCKIEKIHWIRVLYSYPERITDEFLDVMASEEKIVKYLDMPIQHSNGEILKRMHRPGNTEKLTALINHIREKMPDITLRTTLITGFPGETEEQFNELAEFVNDIKFDHLGCFAYSQEEGTQAAEFDDQIDEDVRSHRSDIIMQQQTLVNAEKLEKMQDKTVEAVIEGFDKYAEVYFGRTKADAPDIDGKIFVMSEKPLRMGEYVNVHITDSMDYDLIGEVAE
ncbi:MAG: 30S ribosomal protein S12 methylthiotransferase RimO [Oscillospiraceae bacterium]|nr:30S ribosomal protein S12 methylthiotransferase RimO [Oscillospiraceae bacterium]MDY3257105.1 30S ribosomal protein S12 methylthiotransferase RimO [Ruminococcus callidus]